MQSWPSSKVRSFVSAALTAFLTADAASTMCNLLRSATGSFGVSVVCAKERGTAVLAAWGQVSVFATGRCKPGVEERNA